MADYDVPQAGKSSEKPCDKTGVRGSNPRSPTTPYWRIVLVILSVSLTKKSAPTAIRRGEMSCYGASPSSPLEIPIAM